MSGSRSSCRAVAEIRTGENQMAGARIGNRSIHQFWYLYSPYFRHVLLAPHRRPDSDRVTWSWQEAAEAKPPTTPELAEVRRRLTDANRALADDLVDLGSSEGSEGNSAPSLDAQVWRNLQAMITSLCAKSDHALGGYVCRTPAGLMLHSWSASTPAAPYYPDSRQGGIKGTVWLDGQAASGVTVVLQNKQDADLDHAISDRTGAFGFQNVAPGQYRIRVTGRGDFPAEGLAVAVGHETIVGVELRGGSSGPAVARSASSADSPSGHKRRRLAGFALLTLLGAGGLVWRYITKPATSPDVGGKTPFAWQSASGKLAGPGEPAPADNTHKADGAGPSSGLSRTISPTKALKIPRLRDAEPNFSDDRSPTLPAAELAEPSLRVPKEKSPSGDSTDKNRLPRSDAKQPRGSDRVEPPATEPTDLNSVPADDAAQDEPDRAGTRPSEDKTSDLATALAAKKRQTVPNSSLSSVDNLSAEVSLSGEAQLTQAESFSAIPKGGSPSARTARAAKSKGSGNADQSPVSAAAAESGMSTEASPGSDVAESTDHAQARSGAKRKQRAGLTGATATTASTRTASTGEETKENEEPAPAETGNAQTPARSAARTNQPAVRPAETPSQSAEKNLPGGQADSEAEKTPAAPPPAEESAKSTEPADRASSASETSLPALANSVQPGETPSATPAASPSGSNANPAARSTRSGRKNPALPTASQAATESEMPANGMTPLSARPAGDERGDGQWVPLDRVSASAWQSRLVRDLVLPTQPVPEGEDDALETMQANLLQKRKAQMPTTFRQPVTTSSGLAFEFPSGETGPGRLLRWRDAAGVEVAGSTVQGNRAELAWAGANAPHGIDYVLSDAAGQEFVRVSLDQTGAPKITARPRVLSWYWVGIEHAPADATALLSEQAEPRLSWRLLAGTADASGWPQDNRWRAGRGQRIDLPIGPSGEGPGSYTLALVDRVTGWAITCTITLR